MSYNPTNWQNGDIVTSAKLNNIEQGIETLSETKGTADTLLDDISVKDAGKVLAINDNGKAALIPSASMYGSPLAARQPTDMVDTTKVYVYTGNDSGNYIKGDWYYYNGSSWESGGAYNTHAETTEIVNDSEKVPTSRAVYNEFQSIIDKMYPVGSLYFTIDNRNPSEYLGGHWVRYAEGKTIFGASSTDEDFNGVKTGGSKTKAYAVGGPNGHNHIPGKEGEKYPANRFIFSSDSITDIDCNISDLGSSGRYIIPAIDKLNEKDTTEYDGFATTEYTDGFLKNYVEGYGSVFTANNLPPYVSCYVWLRVALEPEITSTPTKPTFSIENVKGCFQERVLAVAEELNMFEGVSEKITHFIFITDMHEDATRKYSSVSNYNASQAIAMYLVANTSADKIILGGDYCADEWCEEDYKGYMTPFIENGFADYVYPVSGNHERMLGKYFSKDQNAFPDSGFAGAQARAAICNDFLLSKTNIVGNIEEGYYYLDDTFRKMRFLFINTSDQSKYSMSDNQLRWLGKKALVPPNRDNTWTLVVFGHVNILPAVLTDGTTTNSVEEKNGNKIEEVLATWPGNIAGYFCGHQHLDSIYKSARDIHHVVSYCDKFTAPSSGEWYKTNKPTTREPDGYTSQAVTVVSINPDGYGVTVRRIGAGANRLERKDTDKSQSIPYQYKVKVVH